ncbi:MAG TPA: hypothetical protein VII02_10915 [Gemmatimonadaceae bacterium]
MLGPVDEGNLTRRRVRGLRRLLHRRACPAEHDAAKAADDANEGAARGARVALGSALLVSAGAANHRVFFAELSDWSSLLHLISGAFDRRTGGRRQGAKSFMATNGNINPQRC